MSNASAPENPGNQAEATATGAKKSRKMLLIIIISVVVLGAAGGGGYFYLKRSTADAKEASEKSSEKESSEKSHSRKAKKDEEHAEEDEGEAAEEGEADDGEETSKKSKSKSALSFPDDSEVTRVIELQPYVVNLADKGEARYLRVTVSVGLGGEEGAEEKPNPLFTTRIRNAMLAVLTTKTSEDVLTAEGKAKLRKDLLRAAKAASKEPPVRAIYITEFIVQL